MLPCSSSFSPPSSVSGSHWPVTASDCTLPSKSHCALGEGHRELGRSFSGKAGRLPVLSQAVPFCLGLGSFRAGLRHLAAARAVPQPTTANFFGMGTGLEMKSIDAEFCWLMHGLVGACLHQVAQVCNPLKQ